MEQKMLRGIILSDYEKECLAKNNYLETKRGNFDIKIIRSNDGDDTNYLKSLIMYSITQLLVSKFLNILEIKNLKSKGEKK